MSILHNGSANDIGDFEEPYVDEALRKLMAKYEPDRTSLENSALQEGGTEVGQFIGGEQEKIQPQVKSLLDLTPERIELAKRLQPQLIDLNNNPKMWTQIENLHNECVIPPDVIRDFMNDEFASLRTLAEHGILLERFDPSPDELEVYREYQQGYMSPKELLQKSIDGSTGRFGDFHIMGLIDPTKGDTENLKGYATFRVPPKENAEEYANDMCEILALDGGPGVVKKDMVYSTDWKLDKMQNEVGQMWELDTIVVQRGYRKCGGALILIDAIDKFIEQECGESIVGVVTTVSAGFIVKDEQSQPRVAGKNKGSEKFFEDDLGFTSFATRKTASEVVVHDIGQDGIHDLQVLHPHWSYKYQGKNLLRKELAKKPILKYLGRR